MKKILGLDLGTNSIGWAVVNAETETRMVENKYQNEERSYLKPIGISSAGSRIIPMSADILGDFEKGNSISQTADRTKSRMARRIRERNLLRRERLLRVLKKIGFLPEHFANQINEYGKFINYDEPKLAWKKNSEGKSEFLFQQSFDEMLEDFKKNQPELVSVRENGKQRKVPYDWTIYYLRKKALTQKISKEELAWILLQFNQKRGYYQLRDEEDGEEKANETTEIISAKILSVEKKEKDKKHEKHWYEMSLDNGLTYRAAFYNDVSAWEGESKDFVLKTTILKNGSKKQELSFLPTIDEIEAMDPSKKAKMYAKIKLRTEKSIDSSGKTVGCYIYDTLLKDPNQKIIGKLVRTIERKYYKEELGLILEKQTDLIPELQDDELYNSCINLLYSNNEDHRNNIAKSGFTNLFINDILFYQRPLKRKKFLISNCPYESHVFIDKETGEKKRSSIKCIAKSNPLFQEFRLWQFVQNLRIYQREKKIDNKLFTDVDVTNEKLETENDYVKLFEWLNDRASIKQDMLLKSYFKIKEENGQNPYRWNYVEDKEYPCNKTRAAILAKLNKDEKEKLDKDLTAKIWHLLYSVKTKDEIDNVFKEGKEQKERGIYFDLRKVFSEESIKNIKKIKLEETEYGAYSEKAIKKLLPLMRMGKYWSADDIDAKTKERIDKIITGEYDETIKNRVRDKAINLTDETQFKGLPVWLACYIVYDRHSEAKEITKWESPEDIDTYLESFKQHSLRNPIVEQVITETLRTVRDIWIQEGQIDEIHVELGREMKNPADKRKTMTEHILENENTNLRIKAMLMEFMNPEMGIENVRPYSPSQQDILRIYEEYALNSKEKYDGTKKDFIPDTDDIPEFVTKVITGLGSTDKKKQPSKSEIIKYKCWLEQRYRSPYTGEMIPLAKLFTSAYEIEHIIPQSRYFDDSFSNKVICEAEVNKLKDRQLGFEFIKKHNGEKVQLSQGKTVEIFSEEDYEKFVKEHYSSNRTKMKKLLMEDIPDGFIERQLNDSRYISKLVKGLLSNIVREKLPNGEYEQESVSKNVILCNGSITDRLKKDWGMNDVWNNIILPRFKRLNELTKKTSDIELVNEYNRLFELELSNIAYSKGTTITGSHTDFYKSLDNKEQKIIIDNVMKQLPIAESFLSVNNEGHIIPNMPLELQKGFNKKRIDHRHHAMDAIVIACTTYDHVNLLNNEAAKSENKTNRYQLQRKLRHFEKVMIDGEKREIAKDFLKPWETFTVDAKQTLENIIVSFKQNLRVINKSNNHYESYKDEDGKLRIGEDGKPKKNYIKQKKGDNWAIRKSMHKDTVFGEINLRLKKTVSLNEALKNPKAIINKDFKAKALELLKAGHDAKYIKKYIEDNKDVWSDIDIKKIDVYYFTKGTNKRYFATRKPLDSSYNKAKIEDSVTDTGIQKILLAHLRAKGNDPELAFSPDGIDEMNRNILVLNNGKFHQPIYRVRYYESSDKKFAIGQIGNKSSKFVEASDSTNLFFAVFNSERLNKETGEMENKRSYLTISFKIMIDCQKKYGSKWRNNIEVYLKENRLVSDEVKLLFILSPNDLVYLPTKEDLKEGITVVDKTRIYKFIDSSGTTANFIPQRSAKIIFSIPTKKQKEMGSDYVIQDEYGVGSPQSKNQKAITGELVKETCIPLKVDRLGNIIELNGKKI